MLWSTAGAEAGEGYFGYVIEKALSLDNVFVFTLIFAALAVPRDAQARLLLYDILIALLLRAIFIFVGRSASGKHRRRTGVDGVDDSVLSMPASRRT